MLMTTKQIGRRVSEDEDCYSEREKNAAGRQTGIDRCHGHCSSARVAQKFSTNHVGSIKAILNFAPARSARALM